MNTVGDLSDNTSKLGISYSYLTIESYLGQATNKMDFLLKKTVDEKLGFQGIEEGWEITETFYRKIILKVFTCINPLFLNLF